MACSWFDVVHHHPVKNCHWKPLLVDLEELTEFNHTGFVEPFRPADADCKESSLPFVGMRPRQQLPALNHNYNGYTGHHKYTMEALLRTAEVAAKLSCQMSGHFIWRQFPSAKDRGSKPNDLWLSTTTFSWRAKSGQWVQTRPHRQISTWLINVDNELTDFHRRLASLGSRGDIPRLREPAMYWRWLMLCDFTKYSVPTHQLPVDCTTTFFFYSSYWALVLSPLLSYSYCSCCYSLHRSSLCSSSSRRYCLHLRGSSSVPSSGVFFSSTSSPSSIVESATDVSSSSAPSSNLRVYSGSLSSEAPHFFTNTCPSGLFSSSPSWLLWSLKYSSAPSQCASIGSLSLVVPTAILIKSLPTVLFCLLGACAGLWVAVFFLFVFFSLLYRLNLRGTLGPYSLQNRAWVQDWRKKTVLWRSARLKAFVTPCRILRTKIIKKKRRLFGSLCLHWI